MPLPNVVLVLKKLLFRLDSTIPRQFIGKCALALAAVLSKVVAPLKVARLKVEGCEDVDVVPLEVLTLVEVGVW